jgi:secondary thiamine-phosphate synthase enzyme
MLINIDTQQKQQVVDITNLVSGKLTIRSGLVSVFTKHTTAAVTAADLDPGTDRDFLDFLQSLIPGIKWRHPHDPTHAPDHLLSSIVGPEICVPIYNSKLQLGTWQRIILVEFDGPRERNVEVTQIAGSDDS